MIILNMQDKNDNQITKLLNIDKNNYLTELLYEKNFESSNDDGESVDMAER